MALLEQGFGDSGISGIAGELMDDLGITDLVNGLTGGDTKYDSLFRQNETGNSGVRQYGDQPADKSAFFGPFPGKKTYSFLLKIDTRIVKVPFYLNPQQETISEPHGVIVDITQGGGKLTHSEGCVTKEIVIQGSTGFNPNRRAPSMSGNGTGFEQLKMLQNVFRRYCFLRRYGDTTKDLQLIYVNNKRQEAWVVEPKSFTSTDDVGHNFQYKYQIVLETLYPYTGMAGKGIFQQLTGQWGIFGTISAIAQRLSEAVDRLNTVAGEISGLIDNFIDSIFKPILKVLHAITDIAAGRFPAWKSFTRDSTRSLVRNLRQAGRDLEAMGSPRLAHWCYNAEKEVRKAGMVDSLYDFRPEIKAEEIKRRLDKIKDKAETVAGSLVDKKYAEKIGASVSKRPAASQVFDKFSKKVETWDQFSRRMNLSIGAAAASASTIIRMANDKTLFYNSKKYQENRGKSSVDEVGPNYLTGTISAAQASSDSKPIQVINKSVGQSSIGDTANLAASNLPPQEITALDIIPPSTARKEAADDFGRAWDLYAAMINPATTEYEQARPSESDDIKSLAGRLYGDPGLFPVLVMALDLRAPYVCSRSYKDANNLKNVLVYGENFRYPVPKKTTDPQLRRFRKENDKSLDLSSFERALGADIYIDPNTGDVVWGPNDLVLVYGVDNIGQSIRKRISIKKGTWRRAPTFGLSEYVGLSEEVSRPIIEAEISALFVDDDRISGVQLLYVDHKEQFLIIAVAVFVRNQQDPVIVTLEV